MVKGLLTPPDDRSLLDDCLGRTGKIFSLPPSCKFLFSLGRFGVVPARQKRIHCYGAERNFLGKMVPERKENTTGSANRHAELNG